MILALDTSGRRLGVAIGNSSEVFIAGSDSELRHNELLLGHIHRLLLTHGFTSSDLRAVAVSSGPGSFTGLRVGMAVAKGLCWTWHLPLISVPTLEVYAHTIPAEAKRVVPLMPARAEEVYWSLYEWESIGGWTMKSPCQVNHLVELSEKIPGTVTFCGEGWERHQRKLGDILGERAMNTSLSTAWIPVMESLVRRAARRIEAGLFEDLFRAEPAYHYPFLRQQVFGAEPGA